MRKGFEKEAKKRKKIVYVFLVIFATILIVSGYKIVKWYIENTKTKEITSKIEKLITIESENEIASGEVDSSKIIVNFEELKKINSEVVGYLKVNNTNISYPVVKHSNNDYYLNYSIDKTYNSAGWIFADYRNNIDENDKNLIIYGHNREDSSMFGTLEKILKENWYKNDENKFITFITEDKEYKYQIFSIYQISKEDYYITTDFKNDEFSKFITTIQNRSIYNFGINISNEDAILTLSTCGKNLNNRIVLHAKKIIN